MTVWDRERVAAGLPVYPEDAVEVARMRRRLRRNGVVLIVVLDVLVVAVGLSGASDLRRMATPAGAAAAWADAAAAGDCDRYLDLETPARRAADLAGVVLTPELKSRHDGVCKRVVAAWGALSTQASHVVAAGAGYEVVRLAEGGSSAVPVTGSVLMSHVGGRWRVDRAPAPCLSPAYSPRASLCQRVALPHG